MIEEKMYVPRFVVQRENKKTRKWEEIAESPFVMQCFEHMEKLQKKNPTVNYRVK